MEEEIYYQDSIKYNVCGIINIFSTDSKLAFWCLSLDFWRFLSKK